jgi:hypothetical protein
MIPAVTYRVVLVVAASLTAVLVVLGLEINQRNPHAMAEGPRLDWSSGPDSAPLLACPKGSIAGVYDGSGFSKWKAPKDAVMAMQPDVSSALSGEATRLNAGFTRDDLVQIWRRRTDVTHNRFIPTMAEATIGVRINGALEATFGVSRVPYAGGEPIRWKDAGWVVGGSTICEL